MPIREMLKTRDRSNADTINVLTETPCEFALGWTPLSLYTTKQLPIKDYFEAWRSACPSGLDISLATPAVSCRTTRLSTGPPPVERTAERQ